MPATNESKDGEMELMHPLDIAPSYEHQAAPDYPAKQEVEQPKLTNADYDVRGNLDTVIIFDWDDTLLASTFLAAKGYRLDANMVRCDEVERQLRELELSVCSVLSVALQHGIVHVITNAETGWVQLSAQKFIPAVLPLLERVSVISARSTYEARFPEAPLKWKCSAFQDRISSIASDNAKNVISFGDSNVEREAVRLVTKGLCNTKTKSVKFAERPSVEQLRRQLDLVRNCFHYIYSHEEDLDLMLTISLTS